MKIFARYGVGPTAVLKTLYRLGFLNCLNVAFYKLALKGSVHPACRLKAGVISGPFFGVSQLGQVGGNISSAWIEGMTFFSSTKISSDGRPPNWFTNDLNKAQIHPESLQLPWWRIKDFDPRVSDIKLIWELSRMHWAVNFAQQIREGKPEYLSTLNEWLEDWLRNNPPYYGPNWKCGQEASLRVINLGLAGFILGTSGNPLPAFCEIIELHLKRILPTIPYARAQNNNHGTSEAAALYIGGTLLSHCGFLKNNVYEATGRSLIEDRVRLLIFEDGGFSQYSVNYHRMLVDTLSFTEIWRQHLGQEPFSNEFYRKASLSVNWLFQLTDESSGRAPNIGSNDGTLLFQLTESSYDDMRPSVHLGMTIFNSCRGFIRKGLWNDHLAWLNVEESTASPKRHDNQDFDEFGLKVMHKQGIRAFLRFPKFLFRPSQSDALHLDIWREGENLLPDGGTFGYAVDEHVRKYFFGVKSHNTIEFDDRDQMPVLGRFLFGEWLQPEILKPVTCEDGILSCEAGYTDYRGASHLRRVSLTNTAIRVVDVVQGYQKSATLRWRLPGYDHVLRKQGPMLFVVCRGFRIEIESDSTPQRTQVVEGSMSTRYLVKKSIPVLEIEFSGARIINSCIRLTK